MRSDSVLGFRRNVHVGDEVFLLVFADEDLGIGTWLCLASAYRLTTTTDSNMALCHQRYRIVSKSTSSCTIAHR